jgi:hypothetical protein
VTLVKLRRTSLATVASWQKVRTKEEEEEEEEGQQLILGWMLSTTTH